MVNCSCSKMSHQSKMGSNTMAFTLKNLCYDTVCVYLYTNVEGASTDSRGVTKGPLRCFAAFSIKLSTLSLPAECAIWAYLRIKIIKL